MGIFGFRCFAVLKLVEESDELIFLILRQDGEDTLFSSVFAGLLGLATFLVVGEGVTCINLHDIVDQAHQHDLCDIYGFIGILTEEGRT